MCYAIACNEPSAQRATKSSLDAPPVCRLDRLETVSYRSPCTYERNERAANAAKTHGRSFDRGVFGSGETGPWKLRRIFRSSDESIESSAWLESCAILRSRENRRPTKLSRNWRKIRNPRNVGDSRAERDDETRSFRAARFPRARGGLKSIPRNQQVKTDVLGGMSRGIVCVNKRCKSNARRSGGDLADARATRMNAAFACDRSADCTDIVSSNAYPD